MSISNLISKFSNQLILIQMKFYVIISKTLDFTFFYQSIARVLVHDWQCNHYDKVDTTQSHYFAWSEIVCNNRTHASNPCHHKHNIPSWFLCVVIIYIISEACLSYYVSNNINYWWFSINNKNEVTKKIRLHAIYFKSYFKI